MLAGQTAVLTSDQCLGSCGEMILDRLSLGLVPDTILLTNLPHQRPFSALSAYSIFLETAVETGFIGLSCFLWLLLPAARAGYSSSNCVDYEARILVNGSDLCSLGLLGHGLVDTVWYRPKSIRLGG